MKRFLQLLATRACVGDATVDRLCRLLPSGDKGTSFQARHWDGSPEYAEVVRTLHDAGCSAHGKFDPSGPGRFSCWPTYEYDQSDLDGADFFQMIPPQDVSPVYGRTKEGVLNLNPIGLGRKGPLLSAGLWATIVSQPLRTEMEAAGLMGVFFRPTRAARGRSYETVEEVSWDEVRCEPYWELTASIELPRLSPRCRLVNERGEQITNDDWSNGVFLIEDQSPAGELHYRRSDLRGTPAFDCALTHEPLNVSRPSHYHRKLVLSRRVRDFISARRLRADWLPVYVDNE